MKRVFFIIMVCISCLCIFSQKYYNDTIYTIDKHIPAYMSVSKANIQKGEVNILGRNTQLHEILKLNSESSAVLKDTLTDIAGGFHESYVEYYKGIEVEGTRCTIHYNRYGDARNINGNFRTIKNLSVVPKINEEKALHSALISIGASEKAFEQYVPLKNYSKPEIKIYVKEDIPYLAYKVMIGAFVPEQENLIIFVSANNGNVIAKYKDECQISALVTTRYSDQQTIETQFDSGYFRLRDYTRGNGIETYDSYHNDYTSLYHTWGGMSFYDRAALDAHWGAEKTYDYYYNKFGRNSYDNNGSIIQSRVNDSNYYGALWNGINSYVKYGFYSSDNPLPLVALDIVAHELTHAVTYSTSTLGNSGESGSICEGMSDVFAVCIENEVKPLNDYKIWQIGEDAVILRDLRYPNCKYYNGIGWGPTSSNFDHGYVHNNSGVFGYWFYLLAMGGNETNEAGINLPVTGIGLNSAINICYYMNTVYLTSNSTYYDAALCSYMAAEALGYGDNIKDQINRAWVNVGVEDPRYRIIGDSDPCGVSTYYVENLPNGYTVTWSSSSFVNSILSNNSPSTNMCTITNTGTNAFDTNLTASIKNASGVVVGTVSKRIFNTFDLTFSQQGATYGGTTYNSIPATTFTSNASIWANPVCLITLESPLFNGMTVSTSGATLSYWTKYGNIIKLSFPYSASTQSVVLTGNSGCKAMSLTIYARPDGGFVPIVPLIEAIPTPVGIDLNVILSNKETGELIPSDSNSFGWDIKIFNATSGEMVYSNHIECQKTFVNTTGWVSGVYIIHAMIDGKATSCKVEVR